ncbi:MAG: heme-binding domain-containing protein [Candidatus Hydrogenedentota bacterium]
MVISKRKIFVYLLISMFAFFNLCFVGSWALSQSRVSPPKRHTQPIVSADVEGVLRKACFDCHSNETRYPWYSALPYASSVIDRDIEKGRKELNLSNWDDMSAKSRRKVFKKMLAEVADDEMPPAQYVTLHPDAALTADDIEILKEGWKQLRGKKPADTSVEAAPSPAPETPKPAWPFKARATSKPSPVAAPRQSEHPPARSAEAASSRAEQPQSTRSANPTSY